MTLRKQSRYENFCSTVPPLSLEWTMNKSKKEDSTLCACAFVWGLKSVDNIVQKLRCGLYDRWIEVRLAADVRDIPSPKCPHWGPSSPLAVSSPTTKRPRDELSSHLYLVPRLRMSGHITSFPHTPSLVAPTVELKSYLTKKNIWQCLGLRNGMLGRLYM